MLKTLSLSKRTHLFIKDGALWVKLQKKNTHSDTKPDFYIMKRLPISKLKEIHDWTGQQLKEIGESK